MSSYSHWALLSSLPNFCGVWPESFCGSATIMSDPNLETKLFLFLTHSAWAAPSWGWAGGSPSQGWGTAGREEVMRGPMDVPAGDAPCLLTCCVPIHGLQRPSHGGQRGPGEVCAPGCLEEPMHRECTWIYICIYLFNCSWASSCCSLCAGVSDSSLFHCKENVKTSGKGREAPSIISLEHFPSQAPHTAIIGYFCTPLREDQSTWLFNEILEKTKLKIRVEEHQELTVDKTFSKVFHRQNFTVATISTSQWPWSPPPLHH